MVRSAAQNTCPSSTAPLCKLIGFFHLRSLHVKQSFFSLLTLYVSFPCIWAYLIFKPASLRANVKHFCLHADYAPNKPMTPRQTQAGLLQYHENPLPKDISHTSILPGHFLFLPQLIKEEPRISCWSLPPNQQFIYTVTQTGCSHGFPALKKNKRSYTPRIILAGLTWYDSQWVSRIICLNPDRRSAEPDSVRAENAYLVLLFHGCYTTSHALLQFSRLNAFFAIPLNVKPILPCTSYTVPNTFSCTQAFYKSKGWLSVRATWRLPRHITSAILHCDDWQQDTPAIQAASQHTAPLCFVPWLNSSCLQETYLYRWLKLTLKKNRTHLSLSPQTAPQHTNTLWRTDA